MCLLLCYMEVALRGERGQDGQRGEESEITALSHFSPQHATPECFLWIDTHIRTCAHMHTHACVLCSAA